MTTLSIKRALASAGALSLLATSTAFADESSSSASSVSSASSSSVTSTTPSSTSSVSSTTSSSSESKHGRGSQGKGRGEEHGRGLNKSVDLVCVQTAVQTRENALIAALTARRDALFAAWGMTDPKARKEAQKAAWKTYKQARKSAWKAFRETTKKTCKVAELGEDNGSGDDE